MKTYTIAPAYRETSRGTIVRDGWDLFYGEAWCQRFWYKRDAVIAKKAAVAAAADR